MHPRMTGMHNYTRLLLLDFKVCYREQVKWSILSGSHRAMDYLLKYITIIIFWDILHLLSFEMSNINAMFVNGGGIVLVDGTSSIWMSFIKYTILATAQNLLTTSTVSSYPHQSLLSEEQTSHFWCCTSQLTALQQTHHPQSPLLEVTSSPPSCVTYPIGRLRTWPSSVLFRIWWMLESKFTTQDQRCISASRDAWFVDMGS